jgi:nucleotidyltransferase/DNA polymerase involved in DNA repair
MLVACVLIPRFELAVAAGGLEALAGRAVAIAPDGGSGRIGEVSGAAQAFGVRSGMALGEALARAPALELVAADPVAVAAAWERLLRALERIGAGVESQRPGLACFGLDGLRGIYRGSDDLVLAAARRALERPARLAAAPTRFCALAAALASRPRRTPIVRGGAREYLAPQAVALLRSREAAEPLVMTLERLGIATLGELAALPRASLADRFGMAGAEAHRLACGEDDPPRPRQAELGLIESLELPETAGGEALERALELLIDRLLARPERRGRTLRAATLAARLVDGGSWRSEVTFREALAQPQRMRLALAPRLALLPSPASVLTLAASSFGPPAGEQHALTGQAAEDRRSQLREAIQQMRSAAGTDAALRVHWLEPHSRVPERRVMLTPYLS